MSNYVLFWYIMIEKYDLRRAALLMMEEEKKVIEALSRPGIVYASLEEETARLKALHALGIVHSDPEERFDRITRTAATLFQVPICLISLVTEDQQWFKSCFGVPDSLEQTRGTEREISFCQHAVVLKKPLVVRDPLTDPLFRDNPLVQQFGIRFYAGAPLIHSSGHVLGTLCLIDTKSREFSEQEVERLLDMSNWVMSEIELQRQLLQEKEIREELLQLIDQNRWLLESINHAPIPMVITEADQGLNPVIYVNPAFTELTGYESVETVAVPIQEYLLTEPEAIDPKMVHPLRLEMRHKRKSGGDLWVSVHISPIRTGIGETPYMVWMLEDITERRERALRLADAYHNQINLLNALPDIIYRLDLKGRLVQWNESLVKYSGHSDDELAGMKFIDLFPVSEQEELGQGMNTVLGRGFWESELTMKVYSGVLTPFYWNASLMYDQEGQKVGITGVGKEMTLHEQMHKDMVMAQQVQTSMLPARLEHSGVKITPLYMPYHYVSGDYYDYKWKLNDDVLFGFVMDNMGHGVATALLTSSLRVIIRQASEMEGTLADKLGWINRKSMDIVPEGFFTTLICFEYQIHERRLTYASGGINHFVLHHAEDATMMKVPGALVGVFDTLVYEEAELMLNPGDRVYFFSDGAKDLMEQWDLYHGRDVEAFLYELGQRFKTQQSDDATVLCLEVPV